MKFSVAALLLLIAVVFASMDLLFLAFIVVVILAFLAVTDAVPATAGAASGGSAGVAAGAAESGASGTVKRVTITSDGGKKTKITDVVEKDELKWAPPGKPLDWGKTGYEEFGSGLAQTVFLPLKVAKRVLGWILR